MNPGTGSRETLSAAKLLTGGGSGSRICRLKGRGRLWARGWSSLESLCSLEGKED